MAHQNFECPYCGTYWEFDATANRVDGGSAAGFIWAHIHNHLSWCKDATLEERLQWIDKTEKRHEKRPPMHTVYIFNRDKCRRLAAAQHRVQATAANAAEKSERKSK